MNGNASYAEFSPKPKTADDFAQGSMSKAPVSTSARLPEFKSATPYMQGTNNSIGEQTAWRANTGSQSGMGTLLNFNANRAQE